MFDQRFLIRQQLVANLLFQKLDPANDVDTDRHIMASNVVVIEQI
jgi:hypothetical protein